VPVTLTELARNSAQIIRRKSLRPVRHRSRLSDQSQDRADLGIDTFASHAILAQSLQQRIAQCTRDRTHLRRTSHWIDTELRVNLGIRLAINDMLAKNIEGLRTIIFGE
jgi:hypothetical protein